MHAYRHPFGWIVGSLRDDDNGSYNGILWIQSILSAVIGCDVVTLTNLNLSIHRKYVNDGDFYLSVLGQNKLTQAAQIFVYILAYVCQYILYIFFPKMWRKQLDIKQQ